MVHGTVAALLALALCRVIPDALPFETEHQHPPERSARPTDDMADAGMVTPKRERIRSTNWRIIETLEQGYRRSPTLRALVDTLEASAVLVYIEPGRCPTVHRYRLNGCLISLGTTADAHYLRIIIDVGLPTKNLIATIGHELQHAVEARTSNEVVNGHSEAFIGNGARRVGANVYETDEAQQVKRNILRELQRGVPQSRAP
jgi:hypothetical protein